MIFISWFEVWDHIGGRYLNSQLLCRQGYGYKISRGNSLSSPPSPHKQGQGIQDTLTFPLLLDRFFFKPSHSTDHTDCQESKPWHGSQFQLPDFTDPRSGLLSSVWLLKLSCGSKHVSRLMLETEASELAYHSGLLLLTTLLLNIRGFPCELICSF